MDKYIEILQIFVSEDTYRPAMRVPNIGNKFASATDARSLVFFDKNLLPKNTVFETDFEGNTKYPDIQKFVEMEENCNLILDIERINEVISKCPLIEDTDEEEKEEECSECDGSGEVEYEYRSNKTTHYINEECPICGGEGNVIQTISKPNGKMVKDDRYFIQMGISYLSIFLVEKLLEVSKILSSDIVVVNLTYPNKEIIFKIGDVKVLLMPLYKGEDSEVFCLGNIF